MEAVKAPLLLAHGRLLDDVSGRNDRLQRLSLRAEGTVISKAKNGWSGMFAAGGLLVAASLASGCSDSPPTGPPPTYTVGGTVSGLAGSGLVLRDNGGDDLPVSGNGPVVFATPVASGAAYSVTVFAQPSSPAQRCTVTTGSGTLASANVTTVAIVCATDTYTVGGMVSGLVGSGLVLRNWGGDDLAARSPLRPRSPAAPATASRCSLSRRLRPRPASSPTAAGRWPVRTSRPSPSFA